MHPGMYSSFDFDPKKLGCLLAAIALFLMASGGCLTAVIYSIFVKG
jgi:hypothetical protein